MTFLSPLQMTCPRVAVSVASASGGARSCGSDGMAAGADDDDAEPATTVGQYDTGPEGTPDDGADRALACVLLLICWMSSSSSTSSAAQMPCAEHTCLLLILLHLAVAVDHLLNVRVR